MVGSGYTDVSLNQVTSPPLYNALHLVVFLAVGHDVVANIQSKNYDCLALSDDWSTVHDVGVGDVNSSRVVYLFEGPTYKARAVVLPFDKARN